VLARFIRLFTRPHIATSNVVDVPLKVWKLFVVCCQARLCLFSHADCRNPMMLAGRWGIMDMDDDLNEQRQISELFLFIPVRKRDLQLSRHQSPSVCRSRFCSMSFSAPSVTQRPRRGLRHLRPDRRVRHSFERCRSALKKDAEVNDRWESCFEYSKRGRVKRQVSRANTTNRRCILRGANGERAEPIS
jgi:hypothetical protein